jgi:RNA polymerase sigma-70 factor, ECF subfamily
MGMVGLVMGEDRGGGPPGREAAGGVEGALHEHLPVIGRVVMALLGDATDAERALEQVAREYGQRSAPPDTKPLVWLMALARSACATRLSKLPLRTSRNPDLAPPTERLGAKEAVPARASLARLKPTEREAVVLHLVGGLDAVDVAAACSVDVATAKARIGRGIEQLIDDERKGVER